MTPQKSTQPTTESPKNCNIAEAQEKKKHKRFYINMIEDLKEEIDKAIKEIYENSYTQRKKTVEGNEYKSSRSKSENRINQLSPN